MTAFARQTGNHSAKEEKGPQWWPDNERSRQGWYSDTPLKTDDRGSALKFPPTTFDNISPCAHFMTYGWKHHIHLDGETSINMISTSITAKMNKSDTMAVFSKGFLLPFSTCLIPAHP